MFVFGIWLVIWYAGLCLFSDVGMMLKDSLANATCTRPSRHISPGFSCPSLPNWLDSSLEAWSARAVASSHLCHHYPEQSAGVARDLAGPLSRTRNVSTLSEPVPERSTSDGKFPISPRNVHCGVDHPDYFPDSRVIQEESDNILGIVFR
jgi:hypothetical protein